MNFKDRIKERMQRIKDTYRLAWQVSGERSAAAIVEKYDKWRQIHYWIWWFFFLGTIFNAIKTGELWPMGVGFFGLSNHIFLNQIWWKLRTIEYHYDEVLKENGKDRGISE